MSEESEKLLQQLIKILSNLKKSKFNKIRTETLLERSESANNLAKSIEEKLIAHEENISDSELKFLAKATREYNLEIQQLVRFKLEENGIMTTASTFDLKTATSLVQNYDGSPKGLDSFIDSVNLLNELTNPANIATAIKFIKTRVSGKARLAFPTNATTIAQITTAIKEACEYIESPELVLSKLKALKNKGDQQKFCDEVEALTQKLASVYVTQKIPTDVANKMATKSGVEVLIKGVSNTELKTILKARDFETIQKAVQKINEVNAEPSTQILYVQHHRRRGRQNYGSNSQNNYNRNYGNNNRGFGYNNRPNSNYRGNARGNPNFRGNSRGNYQNGRNFYNQNQNRNGHNVFYAQGNPQQEQLPNVVTGQQRQIQMTPQQHSTQVPQQPPQQHFLGTIASQYTR
jgi:hypothetical protein